MNIPLKVLNHSCYWPIFRWLFGESTGLKYEIFKHALNFLFLLNAACNASVAVPILAPIATRNIFCPLEQTPASFSTPFPGSECMLSVGSGGTGNPIRVHEQFHLGTFLMKSDSVEAGIEALRPVAALWNTALSSFTDNCQQYIRVAKAFVDASDSNQAFTLLKQ